LERLIPRTDSAKYPTYLTSKVAKMALRNEPSYTFKKGLTLAQEASSTFPGS
jgi:hypothetical protein